MQKKSFTGIAADKDLDETALGYNPGDYDYHYIQVLGSTSETWLVKAKAEGGSTFVAMASLPSQTIPAGSCIAVTPEHIGGIEALQVAFSGSVTGMVILVASMNRPGLGVR
tara:strand:- start:2537 stop:2869 length:333 start_codon:yes stop_codon:yes gene_type:complete